MYLVPLDLNICAHPKGTYACDTNSLCPSPPAPLVPLLTLFTPSPPTLVTESCRFYLLCFPGFPCICVPTASALVRPTTSLAWIPAPTSFLTPGPCPCPPQAIFQATTSPSFQNVNPMSFPHLITCDNHHHLWQEIVKKSLARHERPSTG